MNKSDISIISNKRITKNTFLLYIRMLLIMCISLYTSRVILNVLGIENYGIYNVIGGVVSMFGFISSSMTSATQRFITFSLGKGDKEQLRKVFGIAMQIHFLIAFVVVALGEALGLWFLYNKMQIPLDKMNAAFWVLQCSVVSTATLIISIPYNAIIIAHEKMSAFAYISIIEVVLKLLVVYVLLVFSMDKLILYAFLILGTQLLIRFCYGTYCSRHFPETKYKFIWDKNIFTEMISFAGWNLFGNLSGVLFSQGLNMMLNVFFGPVVNAARAVAVQAQNAIRQFVENFQMALNPQITKAYAQGDRTNMYLLMFRSARFSFYLLFFISLPVLFEADFILKIWLNVVPQNTTIFLRIMICTSLLYSVSNPLIIANMATGNVKQYQIICGSMLLTILPLSYVCLKFGFPAYSVFIVHFVIELITQFLRMFLLHSLIGIRIKDYFSQIYSNILLVTSLSVIFPFLIYSNMDDTIYRFFAVSFSSVLSVVLFVYYTGLHKNERIFVKEKIMFILAKLYRN